MFIAFTPTLGVQIVLALFIATLINVNRPAAAVTVWITNVATMVPIYTFNYWVGSLIFSGPPVREVYGTFADLGARLVKLEIWNLRDQFEIMLTLSSSIFIPLLIGSLIVGLAAALLTYLSALIIIRAFLRKRSKKRVL